MTTEEYIKTLLEYFNTPDGKSHYFLEQSGEAQWLRLRTCVTKWLNATLKDTQISDLKSLVIVCDNSNNVENEDRTYLDLFSVNNTNDNLRFRFMFSGSNATLLDASH